MPSERDLNFTGPRNDIVDKIKYKKKETFEINAFGKLAINDYGEVFLKIVVLKEIIGRFVYLTLLKN
jgi:hypothetical protein